MKQHITREQLEKLNDALPDDLGLGHLVALCNAAIQHYITEQAKEFPVLPDHPEPRTMKWSALEIEAIQSYGQQCAAHAREANAELVDALKDALHSLESFAVSCQKGVVAACKCRKCAIERGDAVLKKAGK